MSSSESQRDGASIADLLDEDDNHAAEAHHPDDLLQILQQMAAEDQMIENHMAMSVNLDSSADMEEPEYPPGALMDEDDDD